MKLAGGGLLDHLEELRRRILVSVFAVLVATVGCYVFADRILEILLLPSGGLHLRAFNLMDGFMIKLRLALYAGIVVAFPVWAWQAARFVGPGLRSEEKRHMAPFLVASLVLFAGGTVFGYSLLAAMIRVLVGLFPSRIEYLPSAPDYLSFVTFFLLACGVAFQLPCVLVLLVSLRVIHSQALHRQRKVAWFILFAFAEIITPVSDPIVAPLVVMAPLLILYEASVFIAGRVEARRDEQARVCAGFRNGPEATAKP
ncbi:MAG TPA: twin-arginine translocase subunit TatC [Spirochaetia bacterium]|nr:twin-arginine translocase subunit TatC [Spirochaetia bacterium]